MANAAPYEIIAAPWTLYLAPVGTAFPALHLTPGAPWVRVGTSGDLNYTEDGVTVQHAETVEDWHALGSVQPIKAFRTREGLQISLTVADLSLEQYAIALNHNPVTIVPATAEVVGHRQIGLARGGSVALRALLVKGSVSAYGEDWVSQYEVPIVRPAGEPAPVFTKGPTPAGLALAWMALRDPDAVSEAERFGRLLMQDDELS